MINVGNAMNSLKQRDIDMKTKQICGYELKVGMKVKDWEDSVIVVRFDNGSEDSGIVRCETDKGVFRCGIYAWMTVYVED